MGNNKQPGPTSADVVRRLREVADEVLGLDLAVSWAKDCKAVERAIKEYHLEPSQIVDLYRDYLPSKKCHDIGPSISAALSAHTINLWRNLGGLPEYDDPSAPATWQRNISKRLSGHR